METASGDSRRPKHSFFDALMRGIRRFKDDREHEGGDVIKDALEEVLEEHLETDREEPFSPEEKAMLKNMLMLGEISAQEVMIPRNNIVAVEYDITLSELKEVLLKERHTRMPVYVESLDKLKGYIHLKDLVPALSGDEAFDMDAVLRKILFVAPSMKVVDLLLQMRISGDHMAIVVDEYGGTDGLVTMEDLFEEIVGEIQDEHDTEEDAAVDMVHSITPRHFIADARIRLDKLEEELGGITLATEDEEEEADSLGGLIFLRLGRIPARGEVIDMPNIARLEVIEADPRRIRRVRIVLAEQAA
jgi:magnesium and cobalt transporter